MRKTLVVAALLLLGGVITSQHAVAQTRIEIDCDSVEVEFRTSIQPDSATVEIVSNAGVESHSVTLTQGGTDVVSFPLDGQNGEVVTVTVTLVYQGLPNVQAETETLEGCAEPSPSPSQTIPATTPTSPPVVESPPAPPATVPPSVTPDPTESLIPPMLVRRSPPPAPLPETHPATGPGRFLGLLLLIASLITLGLYARGEGYRRSR